MRIDMLPEYTVPEEEEGEAGSKAPAPAPAAEAAAAEAAADSAAARLIELDLRPLHCPNIRERLEARRAGVRERESSLGPSPFLKDNYFGGGFVSDEDRVALQTLLFAHGGTVQAHRRLGYMPSRRLDRGASRRRSVEAVLEEEESAGGGGRSRRSSEVGSRRSSAEGTDGFAPLPKYAIRSGPRETIYHHPPKVHIAVVTCGGLCPGLNDVAKDYGVPEHHILGVRYGFKAFYDKAHRPIPLTSDVVENVQLEGGTFLGTSEGPGSAVEVKRVVRQARGSRAASPRLRHAAAGRGGAGRERERAEGLECDRCRVPCCVVTVPKSIDNDILLVDRCFGFDTAVEEAQKALLAAKVEASSAYRGVGVVKLMGRESGFIAVQVPFKLEGEGGVLEYMKHLLSTRGHCVVCCAEGAGQDLIRQASLAVDGGERRGENGGQEDEVDENGNLVLHDVGAWLKRRFKKGLADVDIKLIDPSYLIRSTPATVGDRVYCKMLGHGAVHAGFAGYSDVCIGLVNTHYVILPIPVVIQAPRTAVASESLLSRSDGGRSQAAAGAGADAGPAETVQEAPAAQKLSAAEPAPTEAQEGQEQQQQQQPMSKRQLKRIQKQEMLQQKKRERKERERAEKAAQKAERQAAAAARAQRDARHARTEAQRAEKAERRARQAAAMAGGCQRVIVDCDFVEQMHGGELKSLAAQLRYSYAANQRAEQPCHLILTGLQARAAYALGRMKEVFESTCTGCESWLVTRAGGSYLGLGPDALPGGKASLVYLTAGGPHSEHELTELDPSKAYVVGGIVDRNRHKNICLKKAQAQGIATARLPIGQYVQLASSKVLCTNHVVEIILKWLHLRDWGAAFEAVIPSRKRKQEQGGQDGGGGGGGDAEQGGGQSDAAKRQRAGGREAGADGGAVAEANGGEQQRGAQQAAAGQ
eukprot:scaffold6.g2777.t1